jgi:hypothetical protein
LLPLGCEAAPKNDLTPHSLISGLLRSPTGASSLATKAPSPSS